MSRVRIRLTLDRSTWERSLKYAEATHRIPSDLVEEALDQMMARYPRRPRRTENDLDALAAKVAEIIATRVPAGTSGGKTGEG